MKLGQKYLEMKTKARTLTMIKEISEQNVTDALAQFLYATSIINDDQDIKHIELSPVVRGMHTMKLTYNKVKKEVYKTKRNG